MNELEVKQMTISSLEIAEMLGIEHYTLLEKLEGVKKSNGTTKQKGIIPILTDQNFLVSDYFIEDISIKMLVVKRTNATNSPN